MRLFVVLALLAGACAEEGVDGTGAESEAVTFQQCWPGLPAADVSGPVFAADGTPVEISGTGLPPYGSNLSCDWQGWYGVEATDLQDDDTVSGGGRAVIRTESNCKDTYVDVKYLGYTGFAWHLVWEVYGYGTWNAAKNECIVTIRSSVGPGYVKARFMMKAWTLVNGVKTALPVTGFAKGI